MNGGRVTNALIKQSLDQLIQEVKEERQETRRWRKEMEDRVSSLETFKAVISATSKLADEQNEERLVAWPWVRDKLVQPIIIMTVAYLLITVLPNLIVLLATP